VSALQILKELRDIGVEVVPRGEKLVIHPASKVPLELKERLRAEKSHVLVALKMEAVSAGARPTTCSPRCYEIEPGRWVHRAWDGCRTEPIPRPMEAAPQTECKHCGAAGQCSCPACTLHRTQHPVPCLTCQPLKRQAWLAATRAENQKPREEELSCTH
jgi:hypothetical protein